jgi:hypothetical protein
MYMATGFYVTARLSVGLLNISGAVIFPHFRKFHLWNAVVAIVPTAFWIGALWVEYPQNLVVQWVSFFWGRQHLHSLLILDWFPYYFLFLGISIYGRVTGKEKYSRAPFMYMMEFYPAVDMEMRIERTGNFITMVLGYIVVNLIFQSSAVIGFDTYSLTTIHN